MDLGSFLFHAFAIIGGQENPIPCVASYLRWVIFGYVNNKSRITNFEKFLEEGKGKSLEVLLFLESSISSSRGEESKGGSKGLYW